MYTVTFILVHHEQYLLSSMTPHHFLGDSCISDVDNEETLVTCWIVGEE